MNRIVAGVLGLALAGWGSAPAKAERILSVRTKAVAMSLDVDEALRRYPKFHILIVAEGKRDADKFKRDADAERRENPQLFVGHRWTFERTYKLRLQVDRFVSVLREDGTYQGGAHPNTDLGTLMWDSTGKRMSGLADLLVDTTENGATLTALTKLIRASVTAERKQRGVEVQNDPDTGEGPDSVQPKLDKLGAASLTPSTVRGRASGLTFHFAPYAVGAYAEGSYAAFVPFSALTAFLKPEVRGLFAGERPESDVKEFRIDN